MKLGEIKQIKEGTGFKLYTGACNVNVLAVNPTKAELEKLYGRALEKEPVYSKEVEREINGEKKKVKQGRVEFIVENKELNLLTKMTFFVEDSYIMGSRSGKYSVIDNYGNTAWATPDEIKSKAQLLSNKGKPLKIDSDYRLEKSGESELVLFIKNLLGINEPFDYIDEQFQLKPDAANCVCVIEDFEALTRGDVKEIKHVLSFAPGNSVKVILGVRNQEGKNYQSIYERVTMKSSARMTDGVYKRAKEDIERRKANGALEGFTFTYGDVVEYNPQSTTFNNSANTTTATAPTNVIPKADLPF